MAGKKNFQGKETFHRVNFLYQAADMCRQLPGIQGKKLMMIYGSHLTSVCRKTVSRIDMHMKRKICKGCCGLLVPGDTAIVRLTKKPESQVVWVCTMCGAYRIFNTRPDHRVWRDSPNAIVDKIDLNSDSLKRSEHPPKRRTTQIPSTDDKTKAAVSMDLDDSNRKNHQKSAEELIINSDVTENYSRGNEIAWHLNLDYLPMWMPYTDLLQLSADVLFIINNIILRPC